MQKWYGNSWNRIVEMLDSNIYRGLNGEDIEKKRSAYGSNAILIKKEGAIKSIISILLQLWFWVMLIDTYILYSAGEIFGAVIVGTVTIIGILGQLAAYVKKHKDGLKLKSINKQMVSVLRDGITTTVKSEDIVVGDIVMLRKGESVPADIRVIEYNNLKVIEGSVTGENAAVEKYSTKIEEEVDNISNIKNMLFKSSIIAQGDCLGIVVQVGMSSAAAVTLQAMNLVHLKDESIINKYKKVNDYHYIYIAIMSVILTVLIYSKDTNNVNPLFVFQKLFLVGSLYGIVLYGAMLLLGTKFNIENEDIKFLYPSSVLKVSKIDILITEKHSIISDGEMLVKEVYTNRCSYKSDFDGQEWDSNINRVLRIAMLCNSYSELVKSTTLDYNHMIDKCLSLYVEEELKGINEDEICRRLFTIPYDNDRRIMTTVYKLESNCRAYTKGILDSIINGCTHIMANGLEIELSKVDLDNIKQTAIEMESSGLTVIALAYRSFSYEPTKQENIESNMVFVGLMALENTIKKESEEYIENLKLSSVKPVFFTEDTKLTAYAWGKQLGIVKGINELITGVEIDYMSEEELANACEGFNIYSKLTPANKGRIIKCYKDKNLFTAYLCNGIGDIIPAVNSDLNILQSENKILKAFSDMIIRNNFINNILFAINRSKIHLQQTNKSMEFMISSLMSLLLLCGYLILFNKEPFDYKKILWISFFNLTLLLLIILMDKPNTKEKIEDYLLRYESIGKVELIKSYVRAAILTVVIITSNFLVKLYLDVALSYYLLFNLMLIFVVNIYRIKSKKLVSMSNLMYGLIIIFNTAIIFIMNK